MLTEGHGSVERRATDVDYNNHRLCGRQPYAKYNGADMSISLPQRHSIEVAKCTTCLVNLRLRQHVLGHGLALGPKVNKS